MASLTRGGLTPLAALTYISDLLIAVNGELERITGIEPVSAVWKTAALPLSYIRLNKFDAARQESNLLSPNISQVSYHSTSAAKEGLGCLTKGNPC